MADKVVATNRRARHDYEIEGTVEAGLVLTGSEIKSVRAGRVSLQQAYATIEAGEAWLVGAHIAEYENAGYAGHDPVRRRKLLLHRRQIDRLAQEARLKGYTLVPLRMYLKDGWAKVELGVAKGRRKVDKRHAIRDKEMARDIARQMARRNRD